MKVLMSFCCLVELAPLGPSPESTWENSQLLAARAFPSLLSYLSSTPSVRYVLPVSSLSSSLVPPFAFTHHEQERDERRILIRCHSRRRLSRPARPNKADASRYASEADDGAQSASA